MSSGTEKKDVKSRKFPRWVWFVIGGLCAAVILAVVLYLTLRPAESEPSGQDKTEYQPVANKIYYNVERTEWQNLETGLSDRDREEDGYYHMIFACDGAQETYLVKDKKLVNELDKKDMMGLIFDDEGFIVGKASLEEVTGGFVAERFYVFSQENNRIVSNSDLGQEGEEAVLDLTERVKVLDVASKGEKCGLATKLRLKDRILGVKNTDGNLAWLFIVSRAFAGEIEEGYCSHCNQIVEWRLWTDTKNAPIDDGHYRLQENITLTAQQSIRKGNYVVVDLNGKTVTGAENKRVYALFEEETGLVVMDNSEAKNGKIESQGKELAMNGGIVWVRYGLFELYSGTLDASKTVNSANGTAVYINKGMQMNMYGGTILGGTGKCTLDKNGNVSNGMAGSIYVAGTLNMTGGRIQGGKVIGYVLKDGTYSKGLGGNLFVGSDGVVNMSGGIITGGRASSGGGNAYIRGGFNLSGGQISDGVLTASGKSGGNLVVYSTTKPFVMTGGSITGGKASKDGSGGNIWIRTDAQLLGGTITGGSGKTGANVYANNGATVIGGVNIGGDVCLGGNVKAKLSGAPKIGKGSAYGLLVNEGLLINVNGLSQSAEILLQATGFFTEAASADKAACFTMEDGDILCEASGLFAGKKHCLCGSETGKHASYCSGDMLWKPWRNATSVPIKSDNFYLTKNVTATKQITMGKVNGTKKDAIIQYLDLNGYKVTGAEDKRIWLMVSYSVLGLGDWSEKGEGKVLAQGQVGGNGGCLSVADGCSFSLYGGALSNGKAVATYTTKDGKTTSSGGYGGVLSVTGTANIYGGTIEKGNVEKNGGNIYVTGQLNIWGGNILNGYAENLGGNIYSSGSVVMHGGIIQGGQSKNSDTGKVDGASVSANVAIVTGSGKEAATLNMTGGLISGGVRIPNGAQLTLSGEPRIIGEHSGLSLGNSNLIIIEGELGENALISLDRDGYFASTAIAANAEHFVADAALGDNYVAQFDEEAGELYLGVPDSAKHIHCVCGGVLAEDSTHSCSNVTWEPWDGTKLDGYYYLTEDITLDEALKISGSNHLRLCLNGHTLSVKGDAPVLQITGSKAQISICDCDESGKITSSNTTTNGGVVFAQYGTLNLYGGILEMSAEKAGSNGMVVKIGNGTKSTGTFNMYGGTITGGKSTDNGGGVTVAGTTSTFNMYGGTIQNCTTTKNGGGVYVEKERTFNMYDGTITGCSAGVLGGGVYVNSSAIINVSGDARVTGNTVGEAANNVYLTDGAIFTAEELGTNAFVGISVASVEKGVVIGTAKTDPGAKIYDDTEQMAIIYDKSTGNLEFSSDAHASHCICGGTLTKDENHTCERMVWEPWPAELTGGNLEIDGSLCYYLTEDVELTTKLQVKKGTLNICLNGYTLSCKTDVSVLSMETSKDAVINITDCQGGGAIKGSATGTSGQIYVKTGTLNLYGGTLTKVNEGADGLIVRLGGGSSAGRFYMYGGAVTRGNRTGSKLNGGGVWLAYTGSYFEMSGGTIENCTTTQWGGGVYVLNGGSFVMNGGTIQNCSAGALGGGVYVANGGAINLSGDAKIIDNDVNKTTNNVYLVKGATFWIKELTEGACVGISAEAGYKNIGTATKDPGNMLVSDDAGKTISYSTDGTLTLDSVSLEGAKAVHMSYDDYLDLGEKPYSATEETVIGLSTIEIQSTRVGSTEKDTHVIAYDPATKTLHATGIGTALLKIGEVAYQVTVEPAPISLFMITGHSIGQGAKGDASQSMVCDPGQVYSSYEGTDLPAVRKSSYQIPDEATTLSGYSEEELKTMGIGGATTNRPTGIDALQAGGGGTPGADSGLALRWNALTGEKVWILNAGLGSSTLTEWQTGRTGYTSTSDTDGWGYYHAVDLFRRAQTILQNEVEAGHYTLSHMAIFNFSSANGDQNWDSDVYTNSFNNMWNGFKADLTMNFGGGTTRTVESIGLIPICSLGTVTSNGYTPGNHTKLTNGKIVNHYMAASAKYEDVYMASIAHSAWVTDAGVAEYFNTWYETNDLNKAVQSGNIIAKPQKTYDVFAYTEDPNDDIKDSVHYWQIGYNAIGQELAYRMQEYYANETGGSSLSFVTPEREPITGTVTLTVNQKYQIGVMVAPGGRLTFVAEGAISLVETEPGTIQAISKGTGTLTVKEGDKVLKTLEFKVE